MSHTTIRISIQTKPCHRCGTNKPDTLWLQWTGRHRKCPTTPNEEGGK